jgi:hypothetical protein
MSQITGIVYIKVDGQLIRSEDGATIATGGKEREEVMASGELAGYREKAVPAEIECKMPHSVAAPDMVDINGWVDKTVGFETDTGITYLVTNAFLVSPTKMDGGLVEMMFRGDPAIKQ